MKLSDLNFKPHPMGMGGSQAEHEFPNGYGVSVITGSMFYTSDDAPYEIAIIKRSLKFKNGNICYDTPITDDVLRYQTEADVDDVLRQVEEL